MDFNSSLEKLRLNKHNIQYVFNNDYCIFKINDFLDDKVYNFIDENFPKLKEEEFSNHNLKFSFNDKSRHYNKLLSEDKNFEKIHNFFHDPRFANFFIKNIFYKILKSRMNSFSYFIRMFKINNFKDIKNKFFYNNLRLKVEYSFLKNLAVINPHTDSINKMVSLMLYFPDKRIDLDFQKKFGTIFWSSKEKNYFNKHINNKTDVEEFINNNKIIYKTNFEKYHLFGFIRNSRSWHSVEKILMNKNYMRRSININIFFQ